MDASAGAQLLYAVGNAPVRTYPFPHIYVRDVFPADFYTRLRAHLPPQDHFRTLTSLQRVFGPYPETRLVLPLTPESVDALDEPFRRFWRDTGKWLLSGDEFMPLALRKFASFLNERFGDYRNQAFKHEALLVQDYSTYKLDPHTDSPQKVLSFLFYLPADDSLSHLGTSIYVPKDRSKVSDGIGHCAPADFNRVLTLPFRPNTLFAFVRTPNSFHGVEPIPENEPRRDLLLYDVKTEGRIPTA